MPQTNFRGVALVHLHDFVLEKFGEEGMRRVLARLSPAAAAAYRVPVARDWYPLALQAEVETVIAEELYGGDYSQATQWGRYDAIRQIGRFYRYLFRILDPAMLISKADQLWSSSMSDGTCEVERVGPHELLVKLSGYDPQHKVICYDWQGSFAGMMEACGVKPTVVHESCRLEGAPACAYRVRWS
jgi:uncharacterized protein (TIGR02265 family)